MVSEYIHVLVMSTATYDWADEQYLTMGLDPATAKFIGVKNPMNFRLGASSTCCICLAVSSELKSEIRLGVSSTVQGTQITRMSKGTASL